MGGGVAGCDVFLQCDRKRLNCAVYHTLEHLWEVEVGNIYDARGGGGGSHGDVMMTPLVEKKDCGQPLSIEGLQSHFHKVWVLN